MRNRLPSFLNKRINAISSRLPARLKYPSIGAMAIAGLILMQPANAANTVDIGSIAAFDLGTWNDSGGITESQVFCVVSENSGNNKVYPYWLKVTSLDASGNFALYRNGNPSSSAQSTLNVSFKHKDVVAATNFETLQPDDFESHAHDGGRTGCTTAGDNSELLVELTATELAAKLPGSYIGNFSLTAMGGVNANRLNSANFTVAITIQGAAAQVKISGLDDVNFGAYSGAGDLTADERFCVHSTTSSYRLSVSAASQDANGNFYLSGLSSGQGLPVALAFIDATGTSGTIPVLNAAISGIGDSLSENCSGSDNATLTFALNEQSLRRVATGDYAETFTIMIEPE